MGTRSLTYVYDENHNKLCCMYRQMDGYPSGHGKELAEFLAPITLINGLHTGMPKNAANGMSCLAAQLIAHFKTRIGGIYLEPLTRGLDCDQEYEYHVFENTIQVYEKPWRKRKKLLIDCAWTTLEDHINALPKD